MQFYVNWLEEVLNRRAPIKSKLSIKINKFYSLPFARSKYTNYYFNYIYIYQQSIFGIHFIYNGCGREGLKKSL